MGNQNTDQDNNRGAFITWILVASLLVSAIPPLVGLYLVKKKDVPFDKLGPFGDFFAGSTVPVLTLVGSIGVIITLRMQRQQLEMQRQELQHSLEEMRETRNEIKEQGRTMALQRFESTFFNMLNLHNDIVKSLSLRDDEKTITGRETFMVLFNRFDTNYKFQVVKEEVRNKPYIEQLQHVYDIVYKNLEHRFGHYYGNLDRVLNIIDRANLTQEEKNDYIGILRAQLTSFEVTLLLYYGLSNHGQSLLQLMQKYDFLGEIEAGQLIAPDQDIELYRTYRL